MVLFNVRAKNENKLLKLEYKMLLLEHKLLCECLKNPTCCTCSEGQKGHLETMEEVGFQL